MIQYKLIKEYPGSPKLGTTEWYDRKECKIGLLNTTAVSDNWAGIDFYNAHPKYWKKVEEVDYDILSFIRIDSTCVPKDGIGTLFELQNDGLFRTIHKHSSHTKIQMLEGTHSVKTGFFSIHSVKRLSDGEIFTIGDKIAQHKYLDHTGEIKSFSLKGNAIIVNYRGVDYLQHISKIKTPLFTTEDGVEIFKGDKYFYIVTSQYAMGHEWRVFSHIADGNTNAIAVKPPLGGIQFSIPEKAEEYIINNKPYLSIVELQKWFSEYGIQLTGLDRLREIVKSKL